MKLQLKQPCIIEIGRIPRKAIILKFVKDKVYVIFDKCGQWNNHGFNKSQIQPISK